jgi:hypothetical protein
MKTALKVIAALLVLLVAAAAGVYFVMLRAPEPAPVCEHVVAIVDAELARVEKENPQAKGAAKAALKKAALTQEQCVADLEKPPLTAGMLQIASYRKCLLKAQTMKEVDACSYKGS